MKKLWPIFFSMALICTTGPMDQYKYHIFAGTLLFFMTISTVVWETTNLPGALLFLYVTASATFTSLYPLSPFAGFGQVVAIVFRSDSAQSLLFILSVMIPIFYWPPQSTKSWWVGLFYATILCSSLMIYHLIRYHNPYGSLSNSAMDATFVGLLIPYTFKKKCYWGALILIAATLLSQSSTGLGILGLELLIGGLFYFKGTWERALFILGTTLVVTAGGYLLLGHELTNPNGREHIAKLTWEFFKGNANYWIGAGPGSFGILIPPLEISKGITDVFLWAHNDILQVGFEYGIIGLAFLLIFYASLLWRSRHRPWLFTTLVAAALGALLQMPFRLFPLAMLYALMVKEVFWGAPDDKRDQGNNRPLF